MFLPSPCPWLQLLIPTLLQPFCLGLWLDFSELWFIWCLDTPAHLQLQGSLSFWCLVSPAIVACQGMIIPADPHWPLRRITRNRKAMLVAPVANWGTCPWSARVCHQNFPGACIHPMTLHKRYNLQGVLSDHHGPLIPLQGEGWWFVPLPWNLAGMVQAYWGLSFPLGIAAKFSWDSFPQAPAWSDPEAPVTWTEQISPFLFSTWPSCFSPTKPLCLRSMSIWAQQNNSIWAPHSLERGKTVFKMNFWSLWSESLAWPRGFKENYLKCMRFHRVQMTFKLPRTMTICNVKKSVIQSFWFCPMAQIILRHFFRLSETQLMSLFFFFSFHKAIVRERGTFLEQVEKGPVTSPDHQISGRTFNHQASGPMPWLRAQAESPLLHSESRGGQGTKEHPRNADPRNAVFVDEKQLQLASSALQARNIFKAMCWWPGRENWCVSIMHSLGVTSALGPGKPGVCSWLRRKEFCFSHPFLLSPHDNPPSLVMPFPLPYFAPGLLLFTAFIERWELGGG